jgi:hypothetical protein
MPEASPWIRKEMVCAERSPEVIARKERREASALAYDMRLQERRREKISFYCTDRARAREPLA